MGYVELSGAMERHQASEKGENGLRYSRVSI